MSAIISALNKLDNAVGKLDSSVTNVENALQQGYGQDYGQSGSPVAQSPQICDAAGNVIDVDFVAKRLDKAIAKVEELLGE